MREEGGGRGRAGYFAAPGPSFAPPWDLAKFDFYIWQRDMSALAMFFFCLQIFLGPACDVTDRHKRTNFDVNFDIQDGYAGGRRHKF